MPCDPAVGKIAMARPAADRQALLAALAAHVLEHGLTTASLRPMAAAAGTSDRMLLYHFGSKDGVIGALLVYLASAMEEGLSAALPVAPFDSEAALIRQVVAVMRGVAFRPYVQVWLDIVSVAARGGEAHRAAAAQIMAIYLDWLAARHPQGRARAAYCLSVIEGVLMMEAIGRDDIAEATLAQL